MRPVQDDGKHRGGHQQQREAVLTRQSSHHHDVGEDEQHTASDAEPDTDLVGHQLLSHAPSQDGAAGEAGVLTGS